MASGNTGENVTTHTPTSEFLLVFSEVWKLAFVASSAFKNIRPQFRQKFNPIKTVARQNHHLIGLALKLGSEINFSLQLLA